MQLPLASYMTQEIGILSHQTREPFAASCWFWHLQTWHVSGYIACYQHRAAIIISLLWLYKLDIDRQNRNMMGGGWSSLMIDYIFVQMIISKIYMMPKHNSKNGYYTLLRKIIVSSYLQLQMLKQLLHKNKTFICLSIHARPAIYNNHVTVDHLLLYSLPQAPPLQRYIAINLIFPILAN